ncbi:MAG: hypothetical protein WAM14_09970, partial [Candidatus Nitrosopolaris sp.]
METWENSWESIKLLRGSKQLLRAIPWDSYWFGNVVCSARLENSNITSQNKVRGSWFMIHSYPCKRYALLVHSFILRVNV